MHPATLEKTNDYARAPLTEQNEKTCAVEEKTPPGIRVDVNRHASLLEKSAEQAADATHPITGNNSRPRFQTSGSYAPWANCIWELGKAAINGNTSCVSALLTHQFTSASLDKSDDTPLMHAVRNKDIATVEALIAAGADINHDNEDNDSALSIAISDKCDQIVTLLLDHGAGLTKNTCRTFTTVARRNDIFLFKRLIASTTAPAEILAEATKYFSVNHSRFESPLAAALSHEDGEIAALILECGYDFKWDEKNNNTAALKAAEKNNLEWIKRMIEDGVDFLTKPQSQYSVIETACTAGSTEVFQFLLGRIDFSTSPRLTENNDFIAFACRGNTQGNLNIIKMLAKTHNTRKAEDGMYVAVINAITSNSPDALAVILSILPPKEQSAQFSAALKYVLKKGFSSKPLQILVRNILQWPHQTNKNFISAKDYASCCDEINKAITASQNLYIIRVIIDGNWPFTDRLKKDLANRIKDFSQYSSAEEFQFELSVNALLYNECTGPNPAKANPYLSFPPISSERPLGLNDQGDALLSAPSLVPLYEAAASYEQPTVDIENDFLLRAGFRAEVTQCIRAISTVSYRAVRKLSMASIKNPGLFEFADENGERYAVNAAEVKAAIMNFETTRNESLNKIAGDAVDPSASNSSSAAQVKQMTDATAAKSQASRMMALAKRGPTLQLALPSEFDVQAFSDKLAREASSLEKALEGIDMLDQSLLDRMDLMNAQIASSQSSALLEHWILALHAPAFSQIASLRAKWEARKVLAV